MINEKTNDLILNNIINSYLYKDIHREVDNYLDISNSKGVTFSKNDILNSSTNGKYIVAILDKLYYEYSEYDNSNPE